MDEDRQAELNAVVRRGLLLLVAFAAVVALGTFLVVHALGLSGSGGSASSVVGQPAPVSPLPTTALPVPGSSGGAAGSSNGGATDAAPSSQPGPRHHARGLRLDASPSSVGPLERINLTGTWPGHDNVGLQVQRLTNGSWTDFPTATSVQMGTFETYVETGRSGVNEFRVYDPDTGTASNSVRVRVG